MASEKVKRTARLQVKKIQNVSQWIDTIVLVAALIKSKPIHIFYCFLLVNSSPCATSDICLISLIHLYCPYINITIISLCPDAIRPVDVSVVGYKNTNIYLCLPYCRIAWNPIFAPKK